MKEKLGYIYKITNLINKKIYIGQRKYDKSEKRYFGGGILIKKAIKKYGKENFKKEILVEYETQKEADLLEKYYITLFDARNPKIGYNISKGGKFGGNFKGLHHTEESKIKIGKKVKGYHHTEETKKKLSELNKNRIFTEETRKKMSKLHKGKPLSDEHKKKLSEALMGDKNPWKGKHFTKEERLRFSEIKKGKKNPMYGRIHSEETKKKMKEAWIRRKERINENNNL